jgi:quinol monooxygenase YgiN
LILALTFALGCGNAVASPAWQAIQPDLVDRGLLPQAAALNGLIFTPDAADGPVLVTPTYRVAEDDAVAFTEAMRHVGRSRRRTGALRWELFRDGNDPTRFVESYLVGTWAEHLRQHESRLTGADRKVRGPGVPLCAR